MLSRFFLENLAAQGYLDITYLALIVWAVVLEVQRPRRGPAVLALLAAAGLLRPDAWFVAGAYWLWCVVPTKSNRVSRRTLLLYTVLAAIGPLVWVLVDLIVTGEPFYSLTSTSGLAQELGRTQGAHRRDRLAVDVHRADRQAAGAARGDRRHRGWRSG